MNNPTWSDITLGSWIRIKHREPGSVETNIEVLDVFDHGEHVKFRDEGSSFWVDASHYQLLEIL